jgi:hypothetical protein
MIYTITTLKIDGPRVAQRSRCVGYFADMMKAMDVLNRNLGDIYENGWYPHAVIEAVPEGLYPIIESRWWYEWCEEKQGYIACADPQDMQGVVNFSMG